MGGAKNVKKMSFSKPVSICSGCGRNGDHQISLRVKEILVRISVKAEKLTRISLKVIAAKSPTLFAWAEYVPPTSLHVLLGDKFSPSFNLLCTLLDALQNHIVLVGNRWSRFTDVPCGKKEMVREKVNACTRLPG